MAISSPYHLTTTTTPSIARRSVSSSPPSLSLRSSFLNSVKKLSATQQLPNCRASQRRSRKVGLSCKCLFGLGVPELVVIAGVVALVFGPKKLPEVGRSIGKTVKSFQQAAKEFETELKKEPDSTTEAIENTRVVREEEKDDAKETSTKEA